MCTQPPHTMHIQSPLMSAVVPDVNMPYLLGLARSAPLDMMVTAWSEPSHPVMKHFGLNYHVQSPWDGLRGARKDVES